ncbi:protein DpdE [Nocardia sp. 348MFTsu5.1]|uniref:protein DpdE n=1 Tax=Nocardia sp. 348MFTsu5.1 TaxID=1172185 RepID=UPI0003AA0619|nr:protein DpdE [Nocardia sp. 348MFTsu5.1]
MPSTKSGDLVETSACGIGRLIGVQAGTARVRYFTGPSSSPYTEREHDAKTVNAAVLRPHTRVYVHDGHQWRIGRIDGLPDERSIYAVALPNRVGAKLGHEAFEVRWNQPVDDPFTFLETLGGESPIVSESRLGFLRKWTRQRAAAAGVEGILQASVELHRHQLAVVRRVASDPVKRYLLADEVGLGKTIEAAALIWRFLAQNRHGNVLVLVPQHLRHQWAEELVVRFRTGWFQDATLRIRSLEDDSNWPAESIGLVVIDEAHRVTRNGSLTNEVRGRIADLAHGAEELYLLSATPVRSNEAGFLDLLHLLDPVHYQPDQVEAFTRRVEDRDSLALICQGLVSDIDEFDLTLYAEQLESEYPEDRLLGELLASATSADDDSRPTAVARVRQHLSEAYRLHSRVLRTRRTPEVMSTFGVRGRKRSRSFFISVGNASDSQRTQLLDRLRLDLLAASEVGELTVDECVDVFREVAQRTGSLPEALLPLLSSQTGNAPALVLLFRQLVSRDVLSNLDPLLDAICAVRADRTLAMVDALAPFTGSRTQSRVVVASSFTESAIAVSAEMSRRWGRTRVATHLQVNSEDDNHEAVERWRKGGSCSILVVDASAEEGANLQIADLLIHLDLPWESFRIEQRIGRCDRHVPTPMGPIESKVVVFGDEPYSMGWLEFASDGCEAFTRSLSSLQYVLNDTEREAQAKLLREGPDALGDAAFVQLDRLKAEHVRIVAHDALDELEVDVFDFEGESIDRRLIKSDQNPVLTSRLITWLDGVGTRISWEDKNIVHINSRPRPQVPIELESKMGAYMNSAIAVARPASVERRLPILRAGHPMLDAIAQHLLSDDRGVAFAMFRPWPNLQATEVAFRSDFLVSASFNSEFVDAASELGLRSWINQLLQDLAPPVVERVMMGPAGQEVTEGPLLRPYDPKRGDLNLMSRVEQFDSMTASLDWSGLCRNAAQQTRNLLEVRPPVAHGPREAAIRVKELIGRRIDRNRARGMAGLVDRDVDGDDVIRLEALVPERLVVDVRPLGCGAILLGDPAILGMT